MQSFIGVGSFFRDRDPLAVATEGLSDPALVIFTAPFEFFKDTACKLSGKFPDAEVIGGVADTVTGGADMEGNISILALFDSDSDISTGYITEIDKYPVRMVKELERSADEVNAGEEDTVCFELCTGSEECLMTTLNSVFESRGIVTFGATVYTEGHTHRMVSYNDCVYDNACVYAVIRNKRGKVKVYRENIYEIDDSAAHVVTKADRENRIIRQLDGLPAFDVYAKTLGAKIDDCTKSGIYIPMGRAIGREVYIFTINSVDADGSIHTQRVVNESDEVYMLRLGDCDKKTAETFDEIKRCFGRGSLMIAANCVHRHRMFEQEGFAEEYYRRASEAGGRIFCVISGGEQFKNQHINQTMVCAVFE